MIFQTSLRRELGRNFAATLVVLTTIVLTMMLIRVLGLASRGSVNPADVFLVLAYFMLGHLSTIMTLCLFIAIVHTLTRIAADHELVIWHASGKGLSSLLGPILRFSWPIVVGIFSLALLVWPWSNAQTQKLRDQYEQRGDLERVSPGQFQESADGTRVFYIDKEPEQATQRSNIFIYESRGNRESIVTAKSGQIETINKRQFLVLNGGQRVVISDEGRNVEVSEFSRFGSLIRQSALGGLGNDLPKTKSSASLLLAGDSISMGELSWRLSLGLAAMNICVLGLALSASANPRQGRSQNYLMAIFVFVMYYNLINVGQGWISAERMSAGAWMLLLHGSFFLAGAAVLAAKHNNWSWNSIRARHAHWLAR